MKRYKRIASAVLTAFFMFPAIVAGAYSDSGYKNGDVNMDGRLTVKDATRIQMKLASLVAFNETETRLADYNLDSKVNIMDVTKIQKVIASIDEPPSEPAETQQTTSVETVQPTSEATEPSTKPSESQTSASTEPPTSPTEETAPAVKLKSNINIYFTNNKNWSKVYFYLYNSSTGEAKQEWPGMLMSKYTTNEMGEKIYSMTVDVNQYDRVVFNDSRSQTADVPLNKASSGFYIQDVTRKTAMAVGTYAVKGADSGKMKTLSLKYPSGYNKKIWIWTPADYKSTGGKFRTLYIMDGQNLFDSDHTDGYGGWEVTDAVESMMANGGRGAVIVGIDNSSGNRDSELTPDLGSVVPSYSKEFASRTGGQFCDFVVNTVMPYIQKNYNVSKAAEDNCIAGSSSGGLEAFYIGLEHRDKFGQIGALSPAFLLFDNNVWNSYLSKFDLKSADMPMLYVYSGKADLDADIYTDVITMDERLRKSGYPAGKMMLSIQDKGGHNESWWRIMFPEMLSWLYEL